MQQKNKRVAILIALVTIGIAVWVVLRPSRKIDHRKPGAFSVEKAVRAAATLENNDFDGAIDLYQSLVQADPSNSVALKNLAVASLGKIDQQIKFLNDPKKDAAAIRMTLPDLITEARARIDRAMETRKDDPDVYQIDVELDSYNIALMDPLMADEDRSQLVEKLKRYAAKFPGNAFIAIRLNDAVEAIVNTNPEAKQDAIEPLIAACKANPRNLYILRVLMGILCTTRDKRVFDFLDQFIELLRPFQWQLAAANRNNRFEELLAIKQQKDTDPEEAFMSLTFWINTAINTSAHDSDRRLSIPNTLALIDLSDIQAAIASAPIVPSKTDIRFEPVSSDAPQADGVMAFDWDVDSVRELLSWKDKTLSLGKLDSQNQYISLATLELPQTIRGIVAADLHEVMAPGRTKSKPDTAVVAKANQTEEDKALAEAEALKKSLHRDTMRDLIVYGEQGVQIIKFSTPDSPDASPQWQIQTEDVGLSNLSKVTAVLPIDWDADSDLDLVLIADGKIALRQNRGNATFVDVDDASLLPKDDTKVLSAVVVDFDRDVDLDVMLSCAGKFAVLENILHGQFRYRELGEEWKPLADASALAVAELDGNYSWDFVAQSTQGLSVVTTMTVPAKSVQPKLKQSINNIHSVAALEDWNNDSTVDFLVANDTGLSAVSEDWTSANLQPTKLNDTRLAAKPYPLDIDNNGLVDFVSVVDGKVAVFRNTTSTNNNFNDVRAKGVSDPGGGGRINQYCIGSTIEIFSPKGYQARVVDEDYVHFGFSDVAPYNLRVLFTNGLTQNRMDPPKNSVIEEVQIPKGSCPFLYGWDGERFALVTDLLWNAPLGLQYAKGKPIPDRRWEHLLIEGRSIQPRGDTIELRLTEELWETAYFDHVALAYFDRPSDVEVHSNEKVGPAEIATPGLWYAHEPTKLKAARDKYGRDWTQQLEQRDRAFAKPFDVRICQGLVEEHWLELDFGPLDTSRPLQLYLTGWIYPTDTSINIGLDQNPELDGPVPPSLWTVNGEGRFQNAIPFIGFPGGKPKTIVVPIDGVFLTDDHRIRIQHTNEIYWDQAFVAHGEFKPMDSAVHPLPMRSAQLQYRGFSAEVLGDRSQPHWYDYQRTQLEPRWPPMQGAFTRYGDVSDIVASDDDHLVVMGAGDEMQIAFETPKEELLSGWVRDYVLHNVGWDKDADLNTLAGQSSLPLPFSKMENYPPPAKQSVEALRIDRLHRNSLTREPQMESFWRNRAAQ